MGRERLKERLRDGPPLTLVASQLNMSRPTLYRQIDRYINVEDAKVDPDLREYFDSVLRGDYSNEEEATKALEQIGFLIAGRRESEREELRKEWEDLQEEQSDLYADTTDSSLEDEKRRQEELNKREKSLLKRAKELGIENLFCYNEDYGPLVWNEGEIRSACYGTIQSMLVLIDADFAKCQEIEVELIVTVSNEDFVMARFRPDPDTRFAEINYLQQGTVFKYRLRWNEGNKVRYAGPYPFEYYGY